MNNVFANADNLHHVFDIKGCTAGRFVANPQRSLERAATRKGIPRALATKETLKDGNFDCDLYLSRSSRNLFLKQLRSDGEFLKRCNIMDYSLLLGVFEKNARSSADLRKDVGYKSMFQAYYGGMSGAGSEGRDLIYYASIIDILQPYDWRKRGETAFKTGMASTDYVHATISAIPSRDYGLRFYNFLYKKTK